MDAGYLFKLILDFQPLTEEEVYTYFETVNMSVDEAKLDEIYLYAMESG